ncbi:MAG: cell division protein ZapA [Chlorobi bacterium]|nr:cell division protein ZapA [Chlorobiota bacterium]
MQTITVQIHGSEYKLRGDDTARIQEAAGIINEQMRFISSKAPTQPPVTIAVLAALNTAELLIGEQERSRTELQDCSRRLDGMSASIYELLEME